MTSVSRCNLIRGKTCYVASAIFLGLCIVAYFVLDSEHYYMSKPLGHVQTSPQVNDSKSMAPDAFRPYTFGGVYTIADVCIESIPHMQRLTTGGNTSSPAKHLVVYNAKYATRGTLHVAASLSTKWRWYDITYRTAPVPLGHRYITRYPAYFVTASCTGNLYHLWEDTLLGLYGTLKVTRRLGSSTSNRVIFRDPLITQCSSRHRYIELVSALGFPLEPLKSFHDIPKNTCFRNAVFGYVPTPSVEVSNFVIQHLPFDITKCPPRSVVIIQRVTRRILNVDELLEAAVELGFQNSKIVTFENMTFFDQYSTVRCTDILVGIHGAGLEWLIMMRPNKGLLELGWKKFGLYFSTSAYAGYRGLKTSSLFAASVQLNWDTFSQMCRQGNPLTKSQKDKIIGRERLLRYDNPWKWADGYFDKGRFKLKLQQLAKRIFGK